MKFYGSKITASYWTCWNYTIRIYYTTKVDGKINHLDLPKNWNSGVYAARNIKDRG